MMNPGMMTAAPATTPAAMEGAIALLAAVADPEKFRALLNEIAQAKANAEAELVAQQEKLAAEMAAAHATRSAELDKREREIAAREGAIAEREQAAEALRAEFNRKRDNLAAIVG